MNLSDYIQSVLDSKNMNLTLAAQKAGVSASTLSRLKSGSSELTPSLAAKLAKVGFDYEVMFDISAKEKASKARDIIDSVNG